MDKKTVRTIITEWLKEHDYDGLCCQDCGCELKDLMPCSGDIYGCIANCQPGYKIESDDEDYDFYIVSSKPNKSERR